MESLKSVYETVVENLLLFGVIARHHPLTVFIATVAFVVTLTILVKIILVWYN